MAKKINELLAPVAESSHKYTRGLVGICAGSQEFPGAAVLVAGGARRGGAGYVKYLDQSDRATQLVLGAYPDVAPIKDFSDERINTWVIGSGKPHLKKLPDSRYLVLDSDAMTLAPKSHSVFTVVTPHEGEALSMGFALRDRVENAKTIAYELHAFCVLKGPGTIIAAPDGTYVIDELGGPELATAGSGDILAGLIGSMLASWQPSNRAEVLEVISYAVRAHSLAGRAASQELAPVVATDILEYLPYVLQQN
jgi:hydroxyethylthiazole kinase-like uncharacterized protein yjeF